MAASRIRRVSIKTTFRVEQPEEPSNIASLVGHSFCSLICYVNSLTRLRDWLLQYGRGDQKSAGRAVSTAIKLMFEPSAFRDLWEVKSEGWLASPTGSGSIR